MKLLPGTSINNHFGLVLFSLVLGVGLMACETCEDCEPTSYEPYVNLQFFRNSDLNSVNVAIREFNGKPGEDISYYQDTTSEFLLPLSMFSDSSLIILTYVSSDDYELELVDSMQLSYERTYETTEKNIVELNSYKTEIISHTFDSLILICGDTLGICKSNESTIKAFF